MSGVVFRFLLRQISPSLLLPPVPSGRLGRDEVVEHPVAAEVPQGILDQKQGVDGFFPTQSLTGVPAAAEVPAAGLWLITSPMSSQTGSAT